MAQIEVEAAAHVLGMHIGERARVEDTPFLRGAIRGGVLRLVAEVAEPEVPADPAAETIARKRHPAGKRLAAAAPSPPEVA